MQANRVGDVECAKSKVKESGDRKFMIYGETGAQLTAGTENEAKRFLRMRKAAQSQIGQQIFSESVWVVMLALCTINSRARGSSVRTVAARANVPRNTALRALTRMEKAALVSLEPDKNDHRALCVRLTSSGIDVMNRAFVAMTTGVTRL